MRWHSYTMLVVLKYTNLCCTVWSWKPFFSEKRAMIDIIFITQFNFTVQNKNIYEGQKLAKITECLTNKFTAGKRWQSQIWSIEFKISAMKIFGNLKTHSFKPIIMIHFIFSKRQVLEFKYYMRSNSCLLRFINS